MKRLHYRQQRTLAQPVEIRGVGYLTGANVTLRFVPAPVDTGVVFVRTDLPQPTTIPAQLAEVSGTNRRTTLGQLPRCVSLVEHVLAALAGMRIDNCRIEVNAPETPGLDGSAQGYVDCLRRSGTVLQGALRPVYAVTAPVTVAHGDATLTLHPPEGEGLRISYLLNHGMLSPIVPQRHTLELSSEQFVREIAPSRTYLLEHEVAELQKQGIGKRTRVTDLLVFGKRGPIENRLHFANEPARHKILDLIGDLSLLGCDLRGHVVGYRSGHHLNVQLARLLAEQMRAGEQRVRQAA